MNMLYADLSACHVSRADMEKIEQQGFKRHTPGSICFTVFGYEEGAFIPLGPEKDFFDGLRTAGMSNDFITLCQYLLSYGVHLLRLDRDGDEDPSLKKYNW